MRDFENELYSSLREFVDARHAGISWSTVPEPIPVVLPTISFELVDNPVDTDHIYDGAGSYTLPKFVVRASVKDNDKATAKQLLACCDEYLSSIGFSRSFGPAREGDAGVFTMYSIYDDNIVNVSTGRVYMR